MKIQTGQTVLLTGASGGLGTFMANAFADRGMNLALVAYPGVGLEAVKQGVEQRGRRALAMAVDFRDVSNIQQVVEKITREFGGIDVLINNAGVEATVSYHELTVQTIQDVLSINLEAPMLLARWVLPGMLERKRGHIVNISSLAGKAGPPFEETYSATKAGLVGFTQSLRATYRGSGVSASVICPGFVEAGIYARLKAKTGYTAPVLMGTSPPEAVVRAVLRAIERDLLEVIVNRYPVRPLLALYTFFPRVGDWVIERMGVHGFFRRVAEALKRQPS